MGSTFAFTYGWNSCHQSHALEVYFLGHTVIEFILITVVWYQFYLSVEGPKNIDSRPVGDRMS